MNDLSGKTAAIALVVVLSVLVGGVMGTGAVDVETNAITDTLFGEDDPDVVMTPHDGPGGQYVVESEDGELRLDFSDPGLTRNTDFEFHRVFDLVSEEDEERAVVWVTHENEDVLRLYDDATGESIEGEENAIALDPGENVTVSVGVDSWGVTDDGLTTTVTFAARMDIPFFEVDIVDVDEEVVAGQTIDVEADIQNVGNAGGEENVRLLVDGEIVDDVDLQLDAEAEETVTFEYETDTDDVGELLIVVETGDDSDEREVTVEPTEEAFFDVTIDAIAEEVDVDDELVVEATIENIGEGLDEQSIELLADGEVVDEQAVELDGDESESIELSWTPGEDGVGANLPIEVRSEDDGDTATIDVNAALIAQASADSYRASVGTEVELRAERSIVPPEESSTFEWELDGEEIGEGETLSTVLSEPGEREVTLTARTENETDTDTITIDVEDDTPPVVSLEVDDRISLGEPLTFDASDSFDNVEIDRFVWDFGDGTTIEDGGEIEGHTYGEPGQYTVSLTIFDTSENSATVTERITVESPRATLSDDEIEFGEIGTGSTSGSVIEIENSGTTPLELSGIEIVGSGAFERTGDAADGELTVEPGETRSIGVDFSPTAEGEETATLEFDDNDPAELGPISLAGAGLEGDLKPVESRVEFGDVSVDEDEQRTVAVENVGEGVVEITGAELVGSDAFEIVDGDRDATLEPGETHDVTVVFEPTVAGDRTANLRVGSEEVTTTVALQGTGDAPQIQISPEDIEFSTIGVGDSSRITVEVRNTGTETLEPGETIVSGDDPGHFRADDVPSSVAAGESETFDLWFEPELDGDHNATLSVESNAPETPRATASVSGSAVGAEIGIDRKTLDFGETEVDETVFLSVTVRNRADSPADLTLESADIVSGDTDVFFIESDVEGTTLEPGESREIKVGFTPDQIGPQSAQMQIESDAANRDVINVWLSNTRSYILVREVGNPTVSVEGFNLVEGDSHEVTTRTSTVDGESVGFRQLNFSNVRGGNFDLDINHGAPTQPPGPTFERDDEETMQYIELDHIGHDPDDTFEDTGVVYQVSRANLPADAEPEDVRLYRWSDSGWEDVSEDAELIETTDDHYIFRIDTPGFSQFAATVPDGEDPTDPSDPGDPDPAPDDPIDDPADIPEEDPEAPIEATVDFGDDDPAISTEEVPVNEIIELDEPFADRLPRALIDSRGGQPPAEDEMVTIDGEQRELSAEDSRIVIAEEPIELSGERSTIGSSEAIADRERLIGAVNVDVPADRADRPATVQLRLPRERFGGSDPDSATVGHRTDDGWELLSTEEIETTGEAVVLAAETPGFSTFGVFVEPDVEYEWTLSDDDTMDGPVLNHTFEEPGIYETELTVTDAFDRSSTSTYQVLANDRPDVEIEVVDRDDEEVTLVAEIENEIGAIEEVTWTFPDGTEATGEEVTTTLEDGQHEIELHVIDEYGAESQTTRTVALGPLGALAQAATDTFGVELELLIQLGMLAGIGLALAVGYRRVPWGTLVPKRRRGPKITELENPTVDIAARRFTIETLTVTGSNRDLDRIRIRVLNGDGDAVMQKELDVSGKTTYRGTPETLAVPPGVTVSAEGHYTIHVRAASANGRDTERETIVGIK